MLYSEAMSQGLPVIYTRGQGFDGQFADGEVGYAVDCFDANEIADKVIDTVNNYEDVSKRCIKLCGEFDWDKLGKQYRDIYLNITDEE